MDISLSEKISRLHDIEFYAYMSQNSIRRSHDLRNILWIIQLPVQEFWLFHFPLHTVLPDLCQFVEVGVEQFVHGRILWKSSVTGNDPVPELEKPASAVGIADVLHEVRRDSKLRLKQMSFILLQIQQHQELTVAKHRLYSRRCQQVRHVLRDCRAEASHLSYLSPYLLQVSRGVLIVREVCR